MTHSLSWSDYERVLVDACPDLSLVLSVDREAVCLYAAGPARALFGWDAAELEGHLLVDRIILEDVPAVLRALASARSGDASTASFRMECEDGGTRWCELSVHRRSDPPVGDALVAVVRDITARRELEAALTRQAETDPLTGVANRTVFRDRVQHALTRLVRSGLQVGILYLDIDHFKALNDSFGHSVGDRVLVETTQRLQAFLRPSDTLARLGGDEFAILVEDVASQDVVTSLAGRISGAGQVPLVLGNEELLCTVSVGVVVTGDPNVTVEELLEQADHAMYRAKVRGRDRVEVFDDHVRRLALGRVAVESMLRTALAEDRLVLEYQPILALPECSMIAAEALVRIRSATSALVFPGVFIDVAHETGLVRRIDDWVLRNAVLQTHLWQVTGNGPGAITVNLNLTARHLADPRFPDELAALLEEHTLVPGTLALEVTEDDLLLLPDAALAALHSLRAQGVHVVLDNFGAGGFSLQALRAFPLDLVKLQRSCIARLETSASERAVVRAVVLLCHDLGIKVLAVGVETTGQLEILTTMGCDQAQGFLWSTSAGPAALGGVAALAARVL